MKKIPTLFIRDETNRRYVTRELTPGCEWVFAGEGTATRKFDGTCVLIRNNGLEYEVWARRQVKEGQDPPPHFDPIEFDAETGKHVGWEPAAQSAFSKWISEALSNMAEVNEAPGPGTYELVGPKVNQNAEHFPEHWLVGHAAAETYPAMNCPLGYDELAVVLASLPWEGIVWHHPDGRMAKLKRKDINRG